MSKKGFDKERYGLDGYNVFLLILAAALMIIGVITSREKYFGVLLMGVALYFAVKAFLRFMSKDSDKCRAQNDKFLSFGRYILNVLFVRPFRAIKEGKKYRFLICPSCSTLMRLPKGEGHIEVKCPVCGKKFVAKT